MQDLPQRKNIRLKEFDYSSDAAYYITLCVKDRHELLGEVVGAAIGRPPEVRLSATGQIVDGSIQNIDKIYTPVTIDKYIVMPNHFHMILTVASGRVLHAPTISVVINQFKGYVSKKIGYSIWQKLFYDHIIRNEEDYKSKWQYIDENPAKWEEDQYYKKP